MKIVEDPNSTTQQPQEADQDPKPQPRFYLTGLALLSAGVIYLFNRMGRMDVPEHLITWQTLLIIAGIYVGEKNRFHGFGWLICIGIGVYFMLDDWYPHFDLHYYFAPLLLIALGGYFLFGRNTIGRRNHNKRHRYDSYGQAFASENFATDDYIDVVSIFGGVNKNVMSKQFKGGEAVSIFGGTEINLMQADFQGRVILELTQIFGGTTVIVPAHWDVKTELLSVFGGTEDNRIVLNQTFDPTKVLIIKGTSIFGGIEIKSY